MQTRYWDSLARAVNHNPDYPAADAGPAAASTRRTPASTSSRGETLKERHNRIGLRPFMFEIERLEAQDIDEEIDFQIADLIFKQTRGIA